VGGRGTPAPHSKSRYKNLEARATKLGWHLNRGERGKSYELCLPDADWTTYVEERRYLTLDQVEAAVKELEDGQAQK